MGKNVRVRRVSREKTVAPPRRSRVTTRRLPRWKAGSRGFASRTVIVAPSSSRRRSTSPSTSIHWWYACVQPPRPSGVCSRLRAEL
ncbi:hypothetical protein WME89_38065 [Sorangium sp. So ce321]|uniref:hypothetical protein n=1 Tax=Sorangium sp. So ce321 TaxID=3133300 RepID=UPI003F5EB6D4